MSVSSSFRKFKIKCSIIIAGWWGDKISGYSYHEDNGQQDAGDEHHREAVNEPGQPVDTVTQAHHPHCLLQTEYKIKTHITTVTVLPLTAFPFHGQLTW